MAGMVFFGSCALEYTCGIWGSTFLVKAKGMALEAAALMITFYYIGIALGRLLSGVLAARLTSRQLLKIGQGVTLAAIMVLLLPLPAVFSGIGLLLVGLGNSPLFRNMLHMTPENFGKEASQSVMGVQMAASYAGIMLAPALFGVIAQKIDAVLFPYYLLLMYVIMIMGSLLMRWKQNKNEGKA